jgi:hypothetical protein
MPPGVLKREVLDAPITLHAVATSAPTMQLLPAQVAYGAPDHVRQALASLGRTEDVRLSPRGTRLAFACYSRDEVAVADVAISRGANGVEILVEEVAFHGSPGIREPHGLDFVDDDLLAVGNRSGVIELLRLPPLGTGGAATSVGSVVCDHGAAGSVAATGEHVLAVHSWANALTRYRVTGDSISGGEVLARRWLDLPDGIATSRDGRWLAISNHNTHDVLVFEAATLDADADPVAVLRGTAYPHGLRFACGDRFVVVADAGAPYVDVFARGGDSWSTAAYPSMSLRVMDDETFVRGHHTPREGGPKGLDVDPRTGVLVVTAEEAPLAFFDLDLALETGTTRPGGDLVRNELERMRDLERSRAETAAMREQLGAVLSTKAWRATAPARAALAALKRLRG